MEITIGKHKQADHANNKAVHVLFFCFALSLFFYSVLFLILQQEKASTATLFLSLPGWLCTDKTAAAASCYFSVGSQVCTIGVIQCTCSMSPFRLRN